MSYYIKKIKEEKYQNSNSSFREIASYILENIDNLAMLNKLNIFEFAANANTSAATITRFCKKIGLPGFKSLFPYLNSELGKEGEIQELDKDCNKHKRNADLSVYIENVVRNIKRVSESDDLFYCCSNAIIKAKRIFLFGFGGNMHIISLLSEYLIRFNFNVVFLPDRDFQVAYSQNITFDDVAIVVSYKFSDEKIYEIVNNCLINHAQKIFLSKERINSIYFGADDIWLSVAANEGFKEGRNRAEVGMLFQLMYLVKIILLELDCKNDLIRQDLS